MLKVTPDISSEQRSHVYTLAMCQNCEAPMSNSCVSRAPTSFGGRQAVLVSGPKMTPNMRHCSQKLMRNPPEKQQSSRRRSFIAVSKGIRPLRAEGL